MEISTAIADLAKPLLPRPAPPAAPSTLSVLAAAFLPVDSAAVRSEPRRPSAPRSLVRRPRRTRRRSADFADDSFSGDGDDGSFGGGGGGGGGGRSWGFGGNWEDESGNLNSSSSSDPAFDFVYRVVLWIALSNCTHFAVKKMGRILAGRWKVVPIRLVHLVE